MGKLLEGNQVNRLERDLQAALDSLEVLNSKFDQLRKDLEAMRHTQGSLEPEIVPDAETETEAGLAEQPVFDKNNENLPSTAAVLGFIPKNRNMQDAGPEAKYFLCTLLAQASRKMIAYYNRELKSLGISAQQLIALGVLSFQEDVSLGKFAESMKISSPTALQMLRRLETMGLLTVEPHPSDGRLNVFKLTEKAHELIPKIHKKVIEFEEFIETQAGSMSLERLVSDLSTLLTLEI